MRSYNVCYARDAGTVQVDTFDVFYSAQRMDLFVWCVTLSRFLVGFRTHLKSMHFHSFIPRGRPVFACTNIMVSESFKMTQLGLIS